MIKSSAITDAVCERLAAGESLRAICRDPTMPGQSTIFQWLNADQQFAEQYARARNTGLDAMSEELLEIADEVVDRTANGTDSGAVARNRLRVEARKWYLSKLAPKKYGDRLELDGKVEVDIANAILAARKRVG